MSTSYLSGFVSEPDKGRKQGRSRHPFSHEGASTDLVSPKVEPDQVAHEDGLANHFPQGEFQVRDERHINQTCTGMGICETELPPTDDFRDKLDSDEEEKGSG